jgi:hypothetical protein
VLTQSATLKAITIAAGYTDSPVSSANFVITHTAASPQITPNGGSSTDSASVTLASATPGAVIRYTLDGSLPNASSPTYGPDALVLTQSATLKAITIAAGYTDSPVSSANFVITSAAVGPYQQSTGTDGLVVMEAEGYDATLSQGGYGWQADVTAGYSGTGGLAAIPNTGANINSAIWQVSPRLVYNVNFAKAGTYYLWVRGLGPSSGDDSVHAGLDGVVYTNPTREGLTNFTSAWGWSSKDAGGSRITITVSTPGLHTVDLWMREDGFKVDKLLLTSNASYVPTGLGPTVSPRS